MIERVGGERKCLSAATTLGGMPGFVNVTFVTAEKTTNTEPCLETSPYVTIDVRGHARQVTQDGHMEYGPQARVVLTVDEFKVFMRDMAVRAIAEGLL